MKEIALGDFMLELLRRMVQKNASDLYMTIGTQPSFRINEAIVPCDQSAVLSLQDLNNIINSLLDAEQKKEFTTALEYNMSIKLKEAGRFRINLLYQQRMPALVIRVIKSDIPTVEGLKLHKIYQELAMATRGLVILSSNSGSGKSTSVAAMVDYRNTHSSGHIITIEDPLEYVHPHKGCIITQREVGIDTHSYSDALKNALRQKADVIVIGEIRDKDTMENALKFSETGHLCIATLHSGNAHQAITRIINFYPEEYHRSILLTLSQTLNGIISQRLLPHIEKGQIVTSEILLNVGLMKTLIMDGRINEIKDLMEKSQDLGMKTFDQSILDAFKNQLISRETAVNYAENASAMRLKVSNLLGEFNATTSIGSTRSNHSSSPTTDF